MAQAKKIKPQALLARARKAWQLKDGFLAHLQETYRYAAPDRDATGAHAPGAKRTQYVFDSTAVVGTQRLANRIQKDLFPTFRRWIQLEAGTDIPDEDRGDIDVELEAMTETFFRHVRDSAFDTSLNEALQDLAHGTGVLLIENGRTATRRVKAPLLRVQAIPAAQIAFDEGPFGSIEGYFHKKQVKRRDLERVFPDAEFPDGWIKGSDPDKEFEVHICSAYDWKNDRWQIEAIADQNGDGKQALSLQSSNANTSPYIAFRWSKAPGEVEGRGPLMLALPDIKTLNKTVELILKNATLTISGVYTAADDGVINPATVRLQPGTIIPVGSNGGARGRSLDVLPRSGDFTIGELVLDKLQTSIKQHLFDKSLPPDTGPVRSPTEIVERIKELQTDLGAPFGRLIVELQIPVSQRMIDIMQQAGELDLPLKVDGREVAIKPTSPLARGQAIEDVQGIADFISLGAPFGPEFVGAGISAKKAGQFCARALGVPADLIPTEADLKKAADDQQAMLESQQLATSPVAAKAVEQIGAGLREQASRAAERKAA
jgi:Bacteriophage head to tail connecting protein